MSFKKEQILDLLGGEEAFDNLVNESMSDKIEDDGYLNYVPEDRGFMELDHQAVSDGAKAEYPGLKRQIFTEERQKIRDMLSGIFDDLKSPETNSEVRLNPDFAVNVTEDDVDSILDAYIDGEE